jgi:hypothetical protein
MRPARERQVALTFLDPAHRFANGLRARRAGSEARRDFPLDPVTRGEQRGWECGLHQLIAHAKVSGLGPGQ